MERLYIGHLSLVTVCWSLIAEQITNKQWFSDKLKNELALRLQR